ncbi:MAG: GNAT family N-acetyltransferase [Clostridia bacterium]
MKEIIFRPIEQKDYEQAKTLICEAFHFAEHVQEKSVLESCRNAYFYSCIAEQSYTCVAEVEGVVTGLIMGQAKSQYAPRRNLGAVCKLAYYNCQLLYRSRKRDNAAKHFLATQRAYSQLLKGKSKMFDGVLTVFAVAKESRGLGLGKKLWENLLDYFVSCDAKNIYLFTDSGCNVGFYDSQGFERLDEKSCAEQEGFKAFLYGFDISKKIK